MASAAVQAKEVQPAADALPRLKIIEPAAPLAPAPAESTNDFSEDEAKALYREGIEYLRDMATGASTATARVQAATKLAQFFVNAANRQKPRKKIVVSFIDPRQLLEEATEDLDFKA